MKNKKNLFGDDAVFCVTFDDSDSYFKHVEINIRYGEKNAKGELVYRHDSYKYSGIAITAQGDTETPRLYAGIEIGSLNHSNIGRHYKAIRTLASRVKHLENNMPPVTIGQFIFMIGNLAGVKEMVFGFVLAKNYSNSYSLAEGCRALDARILELWPHVTERVSFDSFSNV